MLLQGLVECSEQQHQSLWEMLCKLQTLDSRMFSADPLRVLRAVRFASRFDFELDSALVAAARSSEVQTALGSKVSRERFGEELGKMMTGQLGLP